MASQFNHHVLGGLFVLAAVVAETGLLILNRFLLLDGMFKFPYPIATTVVQCMITHLFVLAAEYPIRMLLAHLASPATVDSLEADKGGLLYKDEPHQDNRARISGGFSQRSFSFRPSLGDYTLLQSTRDALPLGTVLSLKVVLGNVFMTHLSIPAYTFLRVGAIPLAFAVSATLIGRSHSIAISLAATFAIVGLMFAVLPSTNSIALGGLALGVSLSIVDALLPLMILRAYRGRCSATPLDTVVKDPVDNRDAAASLVFQLRQGLSTMLPALQRASFISVIFLIPLVFVTGEARHIWNDSYVLDTTRAQLLFLFSGILNGSLLVVVSLSLMAMSPVAINFWTAPSNAIQIAIFYKSALGVYNWSGLAACWGFSICFLLAKIFAQRRAEDRNKEVTSNRATYSIIRTATVTSILCASVTSMARISWRQSRLPALKAPACQMRKSLMSEIVSPQGFNFNSTTDVDYLGVRPHVDTVADLSSILGHCGEVVDGLGIDDVINCVRFLASRSDEYLILPATESTKQANDNSYQETMLHDNGSLESMSAESTDLSEANSPINSTIGICPGTVFPFHVYWSGPATWRFELFVKAYLYTQNLPCSRLWIWLDSDTDINAVDRMLCDDPVFRRFLLLVDRGNIVVKVWHFPKRIPLPKDAVKHIQSLHPHLQDDKLEVLISDNVVQDRTGKWLLLNSGPAAFSPVQVSDAVRFIVLHLHGGVYLDMDVMLMRDMRPLLLQPRAFAEEWVERCPKSDYNTAVLSLAANSSLSTYLLRGGVRMGMNFHPKAIGRMLWRDGRNKELAMLHNAVFDPLVTNLRRKGATTCTVPCHKNFQQAFRAQVEEPEKEWSAYYGSNIERTMDKFFRGSFAYHIHNQWQKFPEPTSWMDVITTAQDGFFEGSRTNAYGEKWEGPPIMAYDRDAWPGYRDS